MINANIHLFSLFINVKYEDKKHKFLVSTATAQLLRVKVHNIISHMYCTSVGPRKVCFNPKLNSWCTL